MKAKITDFVHYEYPFLFYAKPDSHEQTNLPYEYGIQKI